jgi:hypothetical protein
MMACAATTEVMGFLHIQKVAVFDCIKFCHAMIPVATVPPGLLPYTEIWASIRVFAALAKREAGFFVPNMRAAT